ANDGTYVKQVHPWVELGMHSVEKLVRLWCEVAPVFELDTRGEGVGQVQTQRPRNRAARACPSQSEEGLTTAVVLRVLYNDCVLLVLQDDARPDPRLRVNPDQTTPRFIFFGGLVLLRLLSRGYRAGENDQQGQRPRAARSIHPLHRLCPTSTRETLARLVHCNNTRLLDYSPYSLRAQPFSAPRTFPLERSLQGRAEGRRSATFSRPTTGRSRRVTVFDVDFGVREP